MIAYLYRLGKTDTTAQGFTNQPRRDFNCTKFAKLETKETIMPNPVEAHSNVVLTVAIPKQKLKYNLK